MNASGQLLARLAVLGALSASGMTAALPIHADDTSPKPLQRSTAAELATLREAPWDRRGDFILSLKTFPEVLSKLLEDAPAAHSWTEGGSRTGWFGEAWTDVDDDDYDTRNKILTRNLEDADFSHVGGLQSREEGRDQGAGMYPDTTVQASVFQDPCTDRRVTFTRGQETSAAIQIDHVVPLNYLYAHGAWQWDERTRLLAANNPLNLVAVEGEANQAEGVCGPASCPIGSTETGSWRPTGPDDWWPANSSYRCTCARRFVPVAAAYRPSLPQADKAALSTTLNGCLTGGDGTTSLPERAARSAKEVGSVVWRSPRYAALTALGALVLGWELVLRDRRRGRAVLRRRHRSMSRH